MNTTKSNPPTKDDDETWTEYFNRLDVWKAMLQQNGYNLLLKYINELLGKKEDNKYTRLLNVRNIRTCYILQKPKHCRKVAKRYTKLFNEEFNLNFSINAKTDDDDISKTYAMTILQRVCNKLGYKVIHSKKNERYKYDTFSIIKKLN